MSGTSQGTKLIDMPIHEARKEKWRIGREKYGPVFQTNPLEELDSEMLDAMNYVEEAERRGIAMTGIMAMLFGLCECVRAIHRENGG